MEDICAKVHQIFSQIDQERTDMYKHKCISDAFMI